MRRHAWLHPLLLLTLLLPVPLGAQQRLVVHADQARDTISRHIYGHFSEHLGRMIYDGVWTKEGTGQWHLRDDVIEALKRIRIPNLRWPGGCFADYYHWRDGIGPREQRPSMVNTAWGGVVEDNSFGTHEYMELVRRLGTEPFVVGNVGTGSPAEMREWWEYLNHPGGSSLAGLRRQNGDAEPLRVRFWGVGNESWGCGGNMTPEYYSDLFKRFSTFLPALGGVRPFFVATGPNGGDTAWTAGVMREAGRRMNGLDFHYYTRVRSFGPPQFAQGAPPAGGIPAQPAATGRPPQPQGQPQGAQLSRSATNFGEAEWYVGVRNAWRIDSLILRHSAIMDRYDPNRRVWLIVGEWGMWHEVEPGTNPGFLYQQNTLRDAVVAGLHLNIFNNHAGRVKMANLAQTVNVLQSVILTKGSELLLTPTYHVFELYQGHHDAVLLPITLDAGQYTFDGESMPAVSASASRKDGRVLITLVNLDPAQARTIRAELQGVTASRVSGRILTAAALNAHNTFEQPTAVRPVPFLGARLAGGTLTVELPAKSVVAIELQ